MLDAQEYEVNGYAIIQTILGGNNYFLKYLNYLDILDQ